MPSGKNTDKNSLRVGDGILNNPAGIIKKLIGLLIIFGGLIIWLGLQQNPPVSASLGGGEPQLVPWLCGSWFLSGVNVPWQDGGYGADFGTVEEWGQHTYSAATTETMFAALQASQVNSVRWWVFTDGRGAPEFSANNGGNVTGLDAGFLPSMASAVNLAAQYNIYLTFTLWDFAMLFADSTPFDRGEHAGGHRNLIVDDTARQSFIHNALLPVLNHPVAGTPYTLGTHPNIVAWEVINEPEWGITELNAVDGNIPNPVSLAEMQEFVADIAAAIHQNSTQLVTVGSASLKWNSDTALGATGNIWDDADLSPFATDGTLDFYQVHYYPWMDGDEIFWSYSPLFNSFAAAGLDKPTVIGEFPADVSGMGLTMQQMLEALFDNGYAGAWSWSYEGVDGNGGWPASMAGYAAFNQAHPSEVQLGNCIKNYLPTILK